MRALVLLVLAPCLAAGCDPVALLQRIRENVLRSVDRLPRCMCTQSIGLPEYEPGRRIFVKNCDEMELSRETRWKLLHTSSDRLRLDVGIAQ
jgi:hypothetical protein